MRPKKSTPKMKAQQRDPKRTPQARRATLDRRAQRSAKRRIQGR